MGTGIRTNCFLSISSPSTEAEAAPQKEPDAPQILERTLIWLEKLIGKSFLFLNQNLQPENIASRGKWSVYVGRVYKALRMQQASKQEQEQAILRAESRFANPLLTAHVLNKNIGNYLNHPNESGAEEFAETLDLSKLSNRANLMIRELYPWSRFSSGLRWNPQFDDWKNSQPEATRERLNTYGYEYEKQYYRSKNPITSINELRSKLNEALDKPGTELAFDVGNSPVLAELEPFWINQIENKCFKSPDSKLADGFTTNPILLTRPAQCLLRLVEFITKNPGSWRTWHFASTNLITELMQIETDCFENTFSEMILDAIKQNPKSSLTAKFVSNPSILESKPELRKKIIETLIQNDFPNANLIIASIPTVKLLIETVKTLLRRIPKKQYPIYLINGVNCFLYNISGEGELQDLINYIAEFPDSDFAEFMADILSEKTISYSTFTEIASSLYDQILSRDPEEKTKFSKIFYPKLRESGLEKILLNGV